MKITIDRSRKEIRITEAACSQAGRVGFFFACNHPGLTQKGWCIKEERPQPQDETLEYHYIKVMTGGAGEIASFIENPPKPVHDCPKCDCKSECCR